MRVKFNEDVTDWHSKTRGTAYKANKEYPVPRKFGESVVEDGKGVEIKPNRRKVKDESSDGEGS